MPDPRPVEGVPLTVVDGGLHRLMTDGVVDWVEQWVNGRWIRGGAQVDEVLRGPVASPETLKRFGYPASN